MSGEWRVVKRMLGWVAAIGLPAVVLGGLWFARRDPTEPNVQLPTQMADSLAVRAQMAYDGLPGNTIMQLPPEGAAARGSTPFRYGPGDAERKRAGRELTNPAAPTPEALKRGKRTYETFCLPCHGAGGNGDGPLIPKYPNPPSFRSKQTRALTDGEMFHTVTAGRKKMASYASQLDPDERWEVIRYVRTLQTEGTR